MCQEFFSVLQSKKLIHESGIKSFLLNHLSLMKKVSFRKERIFVDLAFSFDACEKDIFQDLSRYKEVCILSPEIENRLFLDQTFDVYQSLEGELGRDQLYFLDSRFKEKKDNASIVRPEIFKIKSETQLEELKKATVQVCKWLEKGVSPQDIVVLAPDMEKYWFALKTYFSREKIPVKKSVFTKVIQFPDIQYFMSALHIHLGHFSFENLESFSFFKESGKDFSEFKSCYFNAPERGLAKNLLFKNKVQSPDKRVTGFQFVEWVLSFWPEKAPDFLWSAVSKALLKCSMNESLKFESWMHLFESEMSALELELEEEDHRGISCLSFNALHSTTSPYVFIMGLDEDSLKAPVLAFVSESERVGILKSSGFSLSLKKLQGKRKQPFVVFAVL